MSFKEKVAAVLPDLVDMVVQGLEGASGEDVGIVVITVPRQGGSTIWATNCSEAGRLAMMRAAIHARPVVLASTVKH